MKRIARGLRSFVAALMVLAGCAPAPSSTATEREICLAWRDSLFLPSRSDTTDTAHGLMRQRDMGVAACPGIIEGMR